MIAAFFAAKMRLAEPTWASVANAPGARNTTAALCDAAPSVQETPPEFHELARTITVISAAIMLAAAVVSCRVFVMVDPVLLLEQQQQERQEQRQSQEDQALLRPVDRETPKLAKAFTARGSVLRRAFEPPPAQHMLGSSSSRFARARPGAVVPA
jgi:hypothetical protein